MPNFGQTTIKELTPMKDELVLRFSESIREETEVGPHGERISVTKFAVQAEQLENDGFGRYLPVEVFTFQDIFTEFTGTVPADYVRERVYTRLLRDIINKVRPTPTL